MLARFFDTDPFSLFDAFERQMAPRPRSPSGVSVTEDQDAYHVVAALPGFKKEDVEITLEADVLTLKGKRTLDAPKDFKLVRSERQSTSFERQISFAAPLAADAIDATLEDGVLTLKLPKAPEAKPRKIALRGATTPTDLS